MTYAYLARPGLKEDFHIEKLDANTLAEANKQYREYRKKYPRHIAPRLLGAPSMETIEKAYAGKIY